MEIKRTIELFTATNRRFVVRRQMPERQTECPGCGGGMLTVEQVARMFGISQRTVFQFVEAGTVHFTEEAGDLIICLRSIAEILDRKS